MSKLSRNIVISLLLLFPTDKNNDMIKSQIADQLNSIGNG